MIWLRKLFFNIAYLGSPRWDTGIAPPELIEFIDTNQRGRALDLGCGTGTNLLALAEAGWDAVGVDFSKRAIRMAQDKIFQAGAEHVEAFRDDVSRLKNVSGQFDLVLDIGCFHSLGPDQQIGYAQRLGELLKPSGTFLLYVFFRGETDAPPGVTQHELETVFKHLTLARRVDGSEGGRGPSAWLWFQKPA